MKSAPPAPSAGLAWLACFLMVTSVESALVDRGGGLLYDDVLDVTWISHTNLPVVLGTHPTGFLSWNEAMAFAANLIYQDPLRNTSWNDWRLPSAYDIGSSTGIVSSHSASRTELGRLFLSGGYHHFTPIPSIITIWTSTEQSTTTAYLFNRVAINQYYASKNPIHKPEGVWLLRDGDVGEAIPEPSLALLLFSGIVLACRRRVENAT